MLLVSFFLAYELTPGHIQIDRTDEFDIAAKFQYKKPKKMVLQLHRADALVKIDILWSNILAMSARFDDARFDKLRIQVYMMHLQPESVFVSPLLNRSSCMVMQA